MANNNKNNFFSNVDGTFVHWTLLVISNMVISPEAHSVLFIPQTVLVFDDEFFLMANK